MSVLFWYLFAWATGVDRTETVSLHRFFDRMTPQELETYAQSGALPAWFRTSVSATTYEAEEGVSRAN